MIELIFLILLYLTNEASMFIPKSYEATFESWKSIGAPLQFRLRVLGREHRLNGTVIISEDMGNDFAATGLTYNDPNGSGDFKQTPLGTPKVPFCKFIENYWSYIEASVVYGKNTNCPFINHTCPIPKGEYYIKDVTIKPDGWPLIMPRGFFKGFVTITKGNEVVGSQDIVVNIVDIQK